MKAKVKDTGEIVEVKFSTHPNPAVDETYWWCKDKQESYHKSELDFMGSAIDWEQRRYEIAKDVLAASFSTPMGGTSIQSYVHDCVQIADILIEELKRGNNYGTNEIQRAEKV